MSALMAAGVGIVRAPKVTGLKKPRPLRRQTSSPERQTDMKPPLPKRSTSMFESQEDRFRNLIITTDSTCSVDNERYSQNTLDSLCSDTMIECNNNILKQSLHYPSVGSRRSSIDSSASESSSSASHRPTTVARQVSESGNMRSASEEQPQCQTVGYKATPHERVIFRRSSGGGGSDGRHVPPFNRQSSTSSSSSGDQSDCNANRLNTGNVNVYIHNVKVEQQNRDDGERLEVGTSMTDDLKTSPGSPVHTCGSEGAIQTSPYAAAKNFQTVTNPVISSKAEVFCSSGGRGGGGGEGGVKNTKDMWAITQHVHKAKMEELHHKLGSLRPADPHLLQKQIQLARRQFLEESDQDVPHNTESSSTPGDSDDTAPSYTSVISMDGEKLVLASRCLKTLMKAVNKICQMKGTHLIKLESTEGCDIQSSMPRKAKVSATKHVVRSTPFKNPPSHNFGQGDGLSKFGEQSFEWQILHEELDTNSFSNREPQYDPEESCSAENLRQYSDKKLLGLAKRSLSRHQPENWHSMHHDFPEVCLLNLEGVYFNPFDLKACNPEAVLAYQPGLRRSFSQPGTTLGWPGRRNFASLNRPSNEEESEELCHVTY
ncbi:uncharacterized protein LOC121388199 [Gigantopelta aegis]|uniref:uncharacterized protein LOC121388199 n=1 Tax=Gigantopelta aegis TaxID=1735272 RepID=UPI001B88C867|nr:uncharacterized protein LOC121388199 [Gigantopelta aegis]